MMKLYKEAVFTIVELIFIAFIVVMFIDIQLEIKDLKNAQAINQQDKNIH